MTIFKNKPGVIFEDEDLLIIDKPAGMVVNRAETTRGQETVQDWVEKRFGAEVANENFLGPQLSRDEPPIVSERSGARQNATSENFVSSPHQMIQSDFIKRGGIVHRLDKETSGLLLVAKTPEAFQDLQKQFKERKVKKTYLALVHGEVKPEEGEIRVPVGRLPWDRKKFGVVAGGREAVTRYKTIYNLQFIIYKEQLTLLELYPETGRTHQIRVHLKYAGYPIFSDSLYGGRKTAREDRRILPRIFLHAAKISFTHPKTGELLSFESELPEELEKLKNSLVS